MQRVHCFLNLETRTSILKYKRPKLQIVLCLINLPDLITFCWISEVISVKGKLIYNHRLALCKHIQMSFNEDALLKKISNFILIYESGSVASVCYNKISNLWTIEVGKLLSLRSRHQQVWCLVRLVLCFIDHIWYVLFLREGKAKRTKFPSVSLN